MLIERSKVSVSVELVKWHLCFDDLNRRAVIIIESQIRLNQLYGLPQQRLRKTHDRNRYYTLVVGILKALNCTMYREMSSERQRSAML